MVEKVTFFWFRRDLRLDDNVGLCHALKSNFKVVPLFIFDDEILDKLPEDDARVGFIHSTLEDISKKLREYDSSLLIKKGNPLEIWKNLTSEFSIQEVYCNHDYEPYAISRDKKVHDFLAEKNIKFKTFKDQVIFEK
ncbi:MAG: deoxyribodipyrimidine photo-lyase, partial [Mangrovimonas sp.]|nr:deoxyribodipyrimidine photo-lyase [Mangrovimonas sp.]